jgi:hypothetical protein
VSGKRDKRQLGPNARKVSFLKETLRRIKKSALECRTGITVTMSTQANGKTDSKAEMGFGRVLMAISTLASGSMARSRGLGCIRLEMGRNMKAFSRIFSSRAKGRSPLQMGMSMKEISFKVSRQDMEFISSIARKQCTKAISKMV